MGNFEMTELLVQAAHSLVDDVISQPGNRDALCRQFADNVQITAQAGIEAAFKKVAAEYGLSQVEH